MTDSPFDPALPESPDADRPIAWDLAEPAGDRTVAFDVTANTKADPGNWAADVQAIGVGIAAAAGLPAHMIAEIAGDRPSVQAAAGTAVADAVFDAGETVLAAVAGDPRAAMLAAAAMTGQTIGALATAAGKAAAAVQALAEAMPEGFDERDLFKVADLTFDVEPSDTEPGIVDPTDVSFPILTLLVQEVVESDQAATLARLDVSARLDAIRAADPELARLEAVAASVAARGNDARNLLAVAFRDRSLGVKVQFQAADGSSLYATWPKPSVNVAARRELKTVLRNAERRIEALGRKLIRAGAYADDEAEAMRQARLDLLAQGDMDVQTADHLGLTWKTSAPSGPRLGFTAADAKGGRS